MGTLKVLRARPALFFRLSGIRLENFDDLVKRTHPLWLKKEHKCLSRKGRLTEEDKAYNRWHSGLRVGVEHAIGRIKKFRIFADIHRSNDLQNMIAKNVGALANINLETA